MFRLPWNPDCWQQAMNIMNEKVNFLLSIVGWTVSWGYELLAEMPWWGQSNPDCWQHATDLLSCPSGILRNYTCVLWIVAIGRHWVRSAPKSCEATKGWWMLVVQYLLRLVFHGCSTPQFTMKPPQEGQAVVDLLFYLARYLWWVSLYHGYMFGRYSCAISDAWAGSESVTMQACWQDAFTDMYSYHKCEHTLFYKTNIVNKKLSMFTTVCACMGTKSNHITHVFLINLLISTWPMHIMSVFQIVFHVLDVRTKCTT